MKINTNVKNRLNPKNKRVVLVLQGGGALGAYQAGVYHAMHDHNLIPDWVVGTSIGAINAALIAGNNQANRLARLKGFWDRVSLPDSVDMRQVPDALRRLNIRLSTVDTIVRGIPGFFSPRLFSLFSTGLAVAPDEASFYDTGSLADTLNDLIDFDYLNATKQMRLTVNAMKVKTGELVNFDNTKHTIGVEHIMASGAMPPGFPPVRVEGELYWDGGLYSNTPFETVLRDTPPVDALCFIVDLWSAYGKEPTTLDEVSTRQKDLMFATRTMRHMEDYINLHKLQRIARELFDRLPSDQKSTADQKVLSTLGCDTTLHVVQLSYAGRDWNMGFKDINFSKGSIEWRWEQGYNDVSRAIELSGWLAEVSSDTSLVVHEITPCTIDSGTKE
ncbi:MAG: patatin-like phospholipase family protein [bacterium]